MGQEKQSRNDQSRQFVGQLALLPAISYLNLQMTPNETGKTTLFVDT